MAPQILLGWGNTVCLAGVRQTGGRGEQCTARLTLLMGMVLSNHVTWPGASLVPWS